MTYKLEQSMPIPVSAIGKTKYPFKQMSVGSSFSFPKEELARVRSAAAYWRRQKGFHFVSRQDPNDQNRCRIWRTE